MKKEEAIATMTAMFHRSDYIGMYEECYGCAVVQYKAYKKANETIDSFEACKAAVLGYIELFAGEECAPEAMECI